MEYERTDSQPIMVIYQIQQEIIVCPDNKLSIQKKDLSPLPNAFLIRKNKDQVTSDYIKQKFPWNQLSPNNSQNWIIRYGLVIDQVQNLWIDLQKGQSVPFTQGKIKLLLQKK